jgi:hypothetical protein
MAIPQLVLGLPVAASGYTITIEYDDATVDNLTLDLAGEAATLYHDCTGVDGRDALATVAALIEDAATYTGWSAARVAGPPYGRCELVLTNAQKVASVTLSAALRAFLGYDSLTPAVTTSGGPTFTSRVTSTWTPPGLWTPLGYLQPVIDRDEAVTDNALLEARSPLGYGVVADYAPGGVTRRSISLDPLYAGSVLSTYASQAGYAQGLTTDPNITWEAFRTRWCAAPSTAARWHPDRDAAAYVLLEISNPWGSETRAALEEVSYAPLLYRWRITAIQSGSGA